MIHATYESFREEYLRALLLFMQTGPSTPESYSLADRLGDLADAYPEWTDRADADLERGYRP